MCFGKKKRLQSSGGKGAVSQRDDRPTVGHDSGHARMNPGSANRNVASQPQDDGPGMADSNSGAARTRGNPDLANSDAEGGHTRRNPERGDWTNNRPLSQPWSRGDPGTHDLNWAKGRALGGPGTIRVPDNEFYNHGNESSKAVWRGWSSGARRRVRAPAGGGSKGASRSQTWSGASTTGYADQKRNLDTRGRPTSEGESSTRNQNPCGVQETFRKAGYGVEEPDQGTHDINTINTSIQHRNTQGKFDCNSGSYNNYGDKDSKFVNEGTVVNNGKIEMNFMRVDRGERLKNTATATIEEELHVPWMVTYCQNKGFTGREDVLRKVESRAQTGGHSRVALWGLGGTGKTQIALEYVYQYQGRRPVFWVHGSSLERFSEEFKSIGTPQIAIDGEGNKSLAAVRKWLESPSSGEWILVLDNADNERDFENNSSPIAQYIPRGPKGTLVVTTRSRQVASRLGCHGGDAIEVREMGAEEARQLFISRYDASSDREDNTAVTDILSLLHHLPLAVVGAAAYMTETSTVPSEYLKMLKQEDATREKLLSQEFSDINREVPTGVAESILSTFFITFDQIQKEYRQAADLLRLITFMKDHRNIPEDALRDSGLEGMDDAVTARNAIGKLVNFSLVTKTASSVGDVPVYELHRLVQISAEVYFKKGTRCIEVDGSLSEHI